MCTCISDGLSAHMLLVTPDSIEFSGAWPPHIFHPNENPNDPNGVALTLLPIYVGKYCVPFKAKSRVKTLVASVVRWLCFPSLAYAEAPDTSLKVPSYLPWDILAPYLNAPPRIEPASPTYAATAS